jgi:DegV family protein with EDD domain
MNKVAILTDSCVYLDPDDAETLGVHRIPLNLMIDNEKWKDGTPEATERFFHAQEAGRELPTVAPPTVAEFEAAYAELHRQTDQIIALHVSHKLSKTYQQSRLGAESLLGRCSIEVIDTMSILLGQGILVKAAAEAANDGATLDDIVRVVRGMIPHIYTVFYVETMDYLERSGRIGKAQSLLGTMMRIKPLLFMEDGEIIPLEKVKTQAKAIEKLDEFVAEFDYVEQCIIFQRKMEIIEPSRALLEQLNELFPGKKFSVIQYNPLLASYVGPTALGVIVYEGLDSF